MRYLKSWAGVTMALGVALGVAACDGGDKPGTSTTKTVVESKSRSPDGDKMVESKTTTEVKTTDLTPADEVGVVECDDYLKKMASCAKKQTADAAEPLKESLVIMRKAWKTAAATADGKLALASSCKQARDAAKAAYAGCDL